MVFCYWFDKSMCNTIHMVDRVVYSPGDKIEVRSFEGGFLNGNLNFRCKLFKLYSYTYITQNGGSKNEKIYME